MQHEKGSVPFLNKQPQLGEVNLNAPFIKCCDSAVVTLNRVRLFKQKLEEQEGFVFFLFKKKEKKKLDELKQHWLPQSRDAQGF